MKISYNWLKSYIPEIPSEDKLSDILTFHLCEVEGTEKIVDDTIFDLNILPNRAHDLLSHQGIAREVASQLGVKFNDPTSFYKIPETKPTKLKIKIETDKCRRYMGRIVRNVKIGPSPDWVKKHLESIGQRSINNIVDATNIVMYDSGQPCHAFDLDKLADEIIIIRSAKEGENIITLDGKEIKLSVADMVIADSKNVLAIAGVKGGKMAEVDENTKNILIEVANFDPISVRKTSKRVNVFTDSSKRFENNLSSELASYAMRELSGLLVEYGGMEFEEIIDIYPKKQETRKLSFSADKMSKVLGINISLDEIKDILSRYNFEYTQSDNNFEIILPPMRFDLAIEEDMVEEIGRILGYEKLEEKLPEINWSSKINENFSKMLWARNKLLNDGYSEVMTYAFRDKGEVEVLASASDKKFLRTNLSDGLKESLKLNQLNMPLLEMNEIKIFEIGTVFKKSGEEMHVAYNEKKNIIEVTLDDFSKDMDLDFKLEPKAYGLTPMFKPWSIYPFISRDVAVWMAEREDPEKLKKILIENGTDLLIKEPYVFDSFTKDGKTSYAFRLIFQSYERTLKDEEVSEIMAKISHKISENSSWQIR